MDSHSDNSYLIMELLKAQNYLLKRINYRLSIHGISYTEYLILHSLARTPNQSLKRILLAEEVGLSASGVTRLLNPMEKRHLISKEKNARDARESLVKITEAGLQVFEQSSNSFIDHAGSLLEKFTTSELNDLSQSIKKLM